MSIRQTPSVMAPAKKSGNWTRNLIGVVISCVCLAFIAWRIDLDEVRKAIAHFHWTFLLWGALSLACGYVLRIARWSLLLKAAGADVSAPACAAPFLGSIALNNVLPMRLGDVVRALVFPSALGIGRATAMGSLVMERLVDLMTLLACLVIGLAANPTFQLPSWMFKTAVTFAVCGGAALALFFFFSGGLGRWCETLMAPGNRASEGPRGRLIAMARELLGSFESMSRLPVLFVLFILSMLIWAGEAGLFWSLLLGFGLNSGPAAAIAVMAIATLSTLLPSSPGYVGPFHLAAYAAIGMLGGTPGLAASFAVLAHLGVWLPTTLAGGLAILANPKLFGGMRNRAAA